MSVSVFALSLFLLAAIPVVMFLMNCLLFRRPRRHENLPEPGVSVLIPARNEAANIRDAVNAALLSEAVDLEVLVLDDDSTDGTSEIVAKLAQIDSRVRVLQSEPLPQGWAGKMWACHQLGKAASKPWLLFVDADVRLASSAARNLVDYARTSSQKPALVSGIPRQITVTWSEQLLIPLIHFILLGYLPFLFMRYTRLPGFGSAIGQLILVDRDRYRESGGHEPLKHTFHDGLKLPFSLRKAGHATDLTDITELATCRMYQTLPEVWNGLLKNAGEGLGSPQAILPMSIFLFGGQVIPWIAVWVVSAADRPWLIAACVLTLIPRFLALGRFHQPLFGAVLHAPGVAILEWIQWLGFVRARLGLGTSWKGRTASK